MAKIASVVQEVTKEVVRSHSLRPDNFISGGKEGAARVDTLNMPPDTMALLEDRAEFDGPHDRHVFTLTGLIAAGNRAGDVLRPLVRDDDKTARNDL